MKFMRCNRCEKNQREGKFCLYCGQPLVEVVTNDIAFKPIDSSRTSQTLKADIRRWLNRIGVQNPDIQILSSDGEAEVHYLLGGTKYVFRSFQQKNVANNLAAVEQFLHYRVLGIERGIESLEQAFAGYKALPDPNNYLQGLSDSELKQELKRAHPDTGTGDPERWALLMEEKKRRKQ